MKNKSGIVMCFLFFLLAGEIRGQSFKEQFNDLLSSGDTSGQRQLLEKWERSGPGESELYVAYFNYYVNRSKTEYIRLGEDPKGELVLRVMDQDTSKKDPVAFIYGDASFDPDLISKGFDWINRGINKFPDRLDMRFGKVYMLGEIQDYENFTNEIVKTVDYSNKNKNQWTWSDDKPLEDAKKFMLSSIQGYQVQLYNTDEDSLLDNMKTIAQAIFKYYPDHIESLSNLSVVYMLRDDYDKALQYLLMAEKLAPQDPIVLGNIGQAYKRKGDIQQSIRYYELVIKYGDADAKNFAQKQIDDMKKR